ncbi:MAG: hypothetical protein ACE5FG_00660 [Myxococcota bacterium]
MPTRSELELRATSYGAEPSWVQVRLLGFDRRERVRRAVRTSLPLFGAAVISLPVPGWHLAAVPGFFVASVVLGIRRLRQRQQVESLAGPCPACLQPQGFPAPARLALPCTLRCPGCGEFVKLENPHASAELR